MTASPGRSGHDREPATETADVFGTERPWKVTIDLPALTARWAGLRGRAEQ